MRTRQQKQIIAHQNKLNKVLRSKGTAMGKVGAMMDMLIQLRQESASMDTDTALAKVILTSRAMAQIT